MIYRLSIYHDFQGGEGVERDQRCEKTELLKWRGLAKVEGWFQK